MRIAELCAGYGGLLMAMWQAGWPVELAWCAETDPDASRVLTAHYPGVPNFGDITAVQFSAMAPVDVLAAGWPCQPASCAGRKRGAGDQRWLWPDVHRAVRVLRPAVFVGENVPGLLTIAGGALFGGVLADLDQLGYTVRWTTVGACRVGLCHHRHRVFLAASRDERVELDRYPLARCRYGRWEVAEDTFFRIRGLAPRWPAAGMVSGGLVWQLSSDVCGDNGVPHMLPTPTARDADRGAGWGDQPGRPLSETILRLLPTPTAVDAKGARNATANRRDPKPKTNINGWTLGDVVYADRWGTYSPAIRRHEFVTGTVAPEPTEPHTRGGVRLAPEFAEWMMGLPAGWVADHVGRSAALRCIGNGVVPLAAAHALSLLIPAHDRMEATV